MKKRRSYFQQFWLLSAIVCVLFLFSSITVYRILDDGLTRQIQNNATFMMDQLSDNVNANMSMLNNMAYYLMADDLVQSVMGDMKSSTLAASQMESQINRALTYNVAWSGKFIKSLFLFRENGTAYSALRESVYTGVQARNMHIFQEYQSFSSTRLLIRPPQSSFCYYIQDYYQINTQQKLGKVIIEINANNLVGSASQAVNYHDANVFLSTEDGHILYAYSGENAWQDETPEFQYRSMERSDPDQYYHLRNKIPGYEMYLDIYIPHNSFIAPVLFFRNILILSCVIMVALFLAFSVIFSLHWKKTFRLMSEDYAILAKGNFSIRMPDSQYREFDEISVSFNTTAEKLGQLFNKNYEMNSLLNQAEYHMLEAQINPHFIMNVLETINMSCLMVNQPQISEMVVDLGMLLKYSVIMKKKQKTTLEQDLDYVRYYLRLQQKRFANLTWEIDVEEPSLLKCFLPKLTIQPIVENSIVHGLENSAGNGTVTVCVWSEESELLIQVRDNGQGFDPSELDLKKPPKHPGKGHYVALGNIQRRIELLYGESYGLSIQSKIGAGAIVTVKLPLDHQPGEEDAESCSM